jgi:hypothetical protein
MHKEILAASKVELLDLISSFSRAFYRAKGTAVALYIGHRQSIDFDLFTESDLNPKSIKHVHWGEVQNGKIMLIFTLSSEIIFRSTKLAEDQMICTKMLEI